MIYHVLIMVKYSDSQTILSIVKTHRIFFFSILLCCTFNAKLFLLKMFSFISLYSIPRSNQIVYYEI